MSTSVPSSGNAPFNPRPEDPTDGAAAGPKIIDDKSIHCIPFILSRLHAYLKNSKDAKRPFIIGLNGVQGAGKTTLVSTLAETLQEQEGLETLVLSIDDLYLTREDQIKLAEEHRDNKLVQYRGEPGTHDMKLAHDLITSLLSAEETKIPSYDKSLHSGLGDRTSPFTWSTVNSPSSRPIRVLILEGWCIGFRSLPPPTIATKQSLPSLTLKQHKLLDLIFVNDKLKAYDVLTDGFDAFIHVDAEDTGWVYEWREEQEEALRRKKGRKWGMSKEEVERFVDGYFPAYELFVEGVREGVFRDRGEEGRGRQLRLVIGKNRSVKEVIEI